MKTLCWLCRLGITRSSRALRKKISGSLNLLNSSSSVPLLNISGNSKGKWSCVSSSIWLPSSSPSSPDCLKPDRMVSVVTELHAVLIHFTTSWKVLWRILPVAVKPCPLSTIHVSWRRCKTGLKLRLTAISSGLSNLFIPPRIVAGTVLQALIFCLIEII